jgi:carboxypeptidase family protein
VADVCCLRIRRLRVDEQSLAYASAVDRLETRVISKQTHVNSLSGPPGRAGPFLALSAGMKILTRICWMAFLLASLGAEGATAQAPAGTVAGTVTLTAADGSTWAGDGARVALSCGADGTTTTEVADHNGAFRFLNVPPGGCSIDADQQGFLAERATVVVAGEQVVAIDLHLDVAPLRVGVNAGGTTPVPRRLTKRCQSGRRTGITFGSWCVGRSSPGTTR